MFVTIPYTLLKNNGNIKIDPETGINVLLDSFEFNIPLILQFVQKTNSNFIISLSGFLVNDSRFNTLFNKVYTLFTLSGNYTNIYIPVFQESSQNNLEGLKAAKEYFTNQGEHAIDFILVTPQKAQVINNILICHQNHLETLTKQQLEQYKKQEIKQLILEVDDFTLRANEDTSAITIARSNDLVVALFEIMELNYALHCRTHECALWEQRSKLYLSFISLSKKIGEGEYYGLKQWYHKEYEVLPLWYKRFGHIIKVALGKRKFRSLFDKKR